MLRKATVTQASLRVSSQQLAVRGFGTSATDDGPKGPLERLRDFLMFRPGATSWANFSRKAVAGKGYRYPSPASRPQPNIPTVENEDDLYNTQYYTRDTKRNQALPKLISPEPPKEFPLEAPPEVRDFQYAAPRLLKTNLHVYIQLGSKGRKNPAVERYDPTGTRSAMTTTWKAMRDELAKHQADHLPAPWWEKDPKVFEESAEHAKKNGLPLPIGVARRSLGIPRYHNQW